VRCLREQQYFFSYPASRLAKVGEEIGSGTNGIVYSGTLKKEREQHGGYAQVALKVLPCGGKFANELLESGLRELAIQQILYGEHQACVKVEWSPGAHHPFPEIYGVDGKYPPPPARACCGEFLKQPLLLIRKCT